jgi:aminoglycoside phosphotransferase family enzyme
VAYLGEPSNYADHTESVEIVETHTSYVFLTDAAAYKLKKPVRYSFLDLSTVEFRRLNCEEALRLNARLAANVYTAVVPLTLSTGLELEGRGEPIDWLLKMRRLAPETMLDRAISEGRVTRQDVVRFTRVLAAFYGDTERATVSPEAYRERLQQSIVQSHRSLSNTAFAFDRDLLDAMRNKLLKYLHRHSGAIDERVEKNRIVHGHGNLRPEHVCIAPEPLFIDCLESNRELRMVDPADELGYLAMECERLGAGHIGGAVLATYRACAGDPVGDVLISFYQARRALARARVAAAHLDEPIPDQERTRWLDAAKAYLELAEQYCSALS